MVTVSDVVPTPAVIVPIPAVTPIETFGATVYPEPPSDITTPVSYTHLTLPTKRIV